MARKWRELAAFFVCVTATAPQFFTLVPPRRAPPFSVCASGAVALKMAQVPTTAFDLLLGEYCLSHKQGVCQDI